MDVDSSTCSWFQYFAMLRNSGKGCGILCVLLHSSLDFVSLGSYLNLPNALFERFLFYFKKKGGTIGVLALYMKYSSPCFDLLFYTS